MTTSEASGNAADGKEPPALRRNRDFVNLWIAESISQVGSHISIIALPLLAISVLNASPSQMGYLTAAGTAPFLLFGLFVGVWVDRVRRRPLMFAADLARGILLLSVPALWWLGELRIEMLYAIALMTGFLTLVFDVSWLTFLPSVVRRNQLVEANGRLQMSASVAQVSGPGAGGLLVGIAGAPVAILIDAISFLFSAVFILRISSGEIVETGRESARNVRREIMEGLKFVYHDPILRPLVYSKIVVTYSAGIFFAVYVLFMADDLQLGATTIGVVFAIGGVGSLVGASFSKRVSLRSGPGMSVVGGLFFFGVFGLTIPLAVLIPAVALLMVVLSELLQWMTYIVAQINEVAIRQVIVPDRYLGRVNSVFQFFGRGMTPLGAITGGLLGEFVGVPLTLVIASAGFFVAFVFVALSPVRTLTAMTADVLDPAT